MTKWLRALASFAEDLNSISTPPQGSSQPYVFPVFEAITHFFWLTQAHGMHVL